MVGELQQADPGPENLSRIANEPVVEVGTGDTEDPLPDGDHRAEALASIELKFAMLRERGVRRENGDSGLGKINGSSM
jgi:hypothetical protein